MRRTVVSLCALLTLAPTGAASAQAWLETADAGHAGIGSAQLTFGPGNLTQIVGDLAGAADIDLYVIRITDEASFFASTVGGAFVDTGLFLFDAAGNPVAFNDDDTDLQSTIDSTLVAANGLYFLGVASFGSVALDENSDAIFSSGPGQLPPIACPSGSRPGCNTFRGRLAGFLPGTEAGDYVVTLSGAQFAAPREPQCLRVPSSLYPTIQSAVNASVNGDTVLVAPGVYNGSVLIINTLLTVRSERGPTETTINGNGATVTTALVADVGPLTVLEGFTVTDTVATPASAFFALTGAPTVRDCVFVRPALGAMIAVQGTGAPILDRCVVRNATAGAISVTAGADARLVNCLLVNNAGTIGLSSGVNASGAGTLVEMLHTTITAGTGGPAVRAASTATITAAHCIVWANPGGDFSEFDPNAAFKRSVFPGASGANISSNPLFQNAGAGDFRPGPGSPAIDASVCANLADDAPGALRLLGPRDLDGRSRFVDAVSVANSGTACAGQGAPDLGCYEASAGVPPLGGCLGDANGDKMVNFNDIVTVLGNWLVVCP